MNPEIPENGLTLILGGARSGKSTFVEKLASQSGKSVLFIATATAGDEEMARRIMNHKASRPAAWRTLEIPLDIGRHLKTPAADLVIVDCITLLVSNLLLSLPEGSSDEVVLQKIREEIEELMAAQVRLGGQWLVVANEVGLGIVPPHPLGRIYRDALGFANQVLAEKASRVIFMVAGIPMVIK